MSKAGNTNAGRFSEDRQPTKRRGRGKSKRTLMLEALKDEGLSEKELWVQVLRMGLAGDSTALSSFLGRLSVPNKATMPKLDFHELDDKFFDMSRTSKLDFLAWSALRGRIPVDQASMLASMITSASSVQEIEVLGRRLAALKEFQEGGDGSCPQSEEYALLQQLIEDGKKDLEILKQVVKTDMDADSDSDDNDNNNDGGEHDQTDKE